MSPIIYHWGYTVQSITYVESQYNNAFSFVSKLFPVLCYNLTQVIFLLMFSLTCTCCIMKFSVWESEANTKSPFSEFIMVSGDFCRGGSSSITSDLSTGPLCIRDITCTSRLWWSNKVTGNWQSDWYTSTKKLQKIHQRIYW